jgi:hypothetical protein
VNFSVVRKAWLILSIVMVVGAVALKYGAGGDSFEMTPTELFVGAAGFWQIRLLFFWQHSNPCIATWRVKMDLWSELLDDIGLKILASCKRKGSIKQQIAFHSISAFKI